MKLTLGIIGVVLALLISGCSKPTAYGKVDKTPYATKECLDELSKGAEIDHSNKIDKIVVYKKKRKMLNKKEGKC